MPIPDIDEHSINAFRRFHTLLPRKADQALVILKVHLLVEEQVRAFLDERTHNSNALMRADLDCHAAICLAEALCTDEIHPRVWEAARKLNELRNKIAHVLEPAGVEQRMDNISSLVGVPVAEMRRLDKSSTSTSLDNFIFATAMLHGELSMYVKKRPAKVVHLVPPESAA